MEEKIYPVAGIVNSPHQFSYENGIVVTCVQPGLARGELRAGPDSINPHGMIHGGAMATLADTVAGCCACSKGGNCVTASSSMEFLRPAQGDLFCEATPKKLGRQLSVIQITITNAGGETVATGTFSFFMARPGEYEKAPPERGWHGGAVTGGVLENGRAFFDKLLSPGCYAGGYFDFIDFSIQAPQFSLK